MKAAVRPSLPARERGLKRPAAILLVAQVALQECKRIMISNEFEYRETARRFSDQLERLALHQSRLREMKLSDAEI
jgi:hypothetical protein